MLLCTAFQVSSTTLTSFRHWGGGGFYPSPLPQNGLLKSPPRLGLNGIMEYLNMNSIRGKIEKMKDTFAENNDVVWTTERKKIHPPNNQLYV